MFLARVRKISLPILGPLVLLWLLCQSMVLCAGLLDGDTSPHSNHSDSRVVHGSAMVEGHHAAASHTHDVSHGNPFQSSALQADDHSMDTEMIADCCDEQESYLSNSFYSSIVFLLFIPLFWLIVALRKRSEHSSYHRAPPPRYNYPRPHVFNCTFLN